MAIYAPKIFPDITIELQHQVLDICKKHGLEVALYGYTEYSQEIKDRILRIDTAKKITHLWQKKVSLKGLIEGHPDCIDSYQYELNKCKELGIQKAIIHNNYSSTVEYIDEPEKYVHLALPIFEQAHKNNLKLHLENIFKPFEFYERFYAEIDKLGMLHVVGFCLDTGHARAFNGVTIDTKFKINMVKPCPFHSSANLDTWLNFMEYIQSRGAGIHYHIHANDTSEDQHISLAKAKNLGLLEPSEDWAPNGYINWLKKASFVTPNAIFCQEHPASEAVDAMAFIDHLKQSNQIY